MAAPAFLMRRRGVAVCRVAAIASDVLAIDVFLSKSDLRRALKFSRGRSRRSRAMSRSGVNFGSSGVEPASMACRASSNRSWMERLGIAALHLRSQALQRPELELLHRSLAAPQLAGDFANASLLHKPLVDYLSLVAGKLPHHAKQTRPVLDGVQIGLSRDAGIGRILGTGYFPCGALRLVGH